MPDSAADCNLLDPSLNLECGPMENPDFGTPRIGVNYDPNTLHGWDKRWPVPHHYFVVRADGSSPANHAELWQDFRVQPQGKGEPPPASDWPAGVPAYPAWAQVGGPYQRLWFRWGAVALNSNGQERFGWCPADLLHGPADQLLLRRKVFGFPGLKARDGSCVGVGPWKKFYDAGIRVPVRLEVTHERALEVVSLEMLEKCARAN